MAQTAIHSSALTQWEKISNYFWDSFGILWDSFKILSGFHWDSFEYFLASFRIPLEMSDQPWSLFWILLRFF